MKLSGKQLFVLVILGMLLLAGVAAIDHTYIPILVTTILTVFGVGLHVNGVNTGVPLSATAPLAGLPTLDVSELKPVAPSEKVNG